MEKYKILDSSDNLESYLKSLKNKKITIITAFASGVEGLIDYLIFNNNYIELTIGTINAFTPPKIIEHCIEKSNKNLALFVDFRYETSTHWKIYLVSPSIVIIGSSNFTKIGINLSRDTCLIIEDKNIFKQYSSNIKELHLNPLVISSTNKEVFNKELLKYKESHNKVQSSLTRSRKYTSIDKWLSNEINQSIPMFIWHNLHSKEEKDKAYELLENDSGISDSDITINNKKSIRDFFTIKYNEEEELPYKQGDVVLCSDSKGTLSYIGFYTFDRIILHKNIYYIFSYKNPKGRYNIPFSITSKQKKELIKFVKQRCNDDVVKINREELALL